MLFISEFLWDMIFFILVVFLLLLSVVNDFLDEVGIFLDFVFYLVGVLVFRFFGMLVLIFWYIFEVVVLCFNVVLLILGDCLVLFVLIWYRFLKDFFIIFEIVIICVKVENLWISMFINWKLRINLKVMLNIIDIGLILNVFVLFG